MRKIVFLFVLISFQFFGQNPHYFTIDKTKGLPSNTIYDIYQDKNDMLWIATNEGICSFDGKKFTIFSSTVQVSKAGSNIVEDVYGRIWYCSFDGYIYYIENGVLKSLRQQKPLGYQKFAIIKDCFVYLEENKLIFLDLKTLKPIKTIALATEKTTAMHTFKGFYYLYATDFLYEISSVNDVKKIEVPEKIKKNFGVSIISNTNDKLLFVSKYSNKYCLYVDGVFKEYDFKSTINFIQNTSYSSNTNWIATTKGIIQFDTDNPTNYQRYFDDFNISTLLKDKEGNHWIGTLGHGLLLVPNFKTYLIPTTDTPSKLVYANKKLVFSTQNDKIYSSVDEKKPFVFKPIYVGKSNHTIEQFQIDTIYKKIYFTSSTFKTSDLNGNIAKEIVLATKEFTPIDATYYAYASSGACGLFKVSDEKSCWDLVFASNEISTNLDNRFSALIQNVRGKSVAYNPVNKTIYFATNTGLFAVNASKKENILWDKKTINLTKVISFKNSIYGLTTNNKLISIDENNHVKTVNIGEHEDIQKIKVIGSSLFLFTSNSIINYNLNNHSTKKIFNLNADNEVSDIIKFKNSYLLASTKGLIRVDANDLHKNCMPKFLLQHVLVNGKKVSTKKLNNLNSTENSIEIQYSVISFVPNLQNILYYKINNGKWQVLDDESRSLKLSSLASGNYTISFKTAFNNTFSPIQTITITIEKPFTESAWFYGLVTLLLLLLVHFFYRYQIQKIKRRNQLLLDKIELEKSLNQSTLKAIKSQMNPHFFYNALNTIQSYILSNDKKQAVNYLSKFSSLTRTILEMSEKETVTVAEEIKTLSFYLDIEKARFNDDFEYEIIINEATLEQIKIPSLLIQPYVENAIKHGLLHKNGAKKLTIVFEENGNYLDISIIDNGIGRTKSEELKLLRKNPHQSFATEAMQHKIDLLNKHKNNKITIEIIDNYNTQKTPKGTTIFIKIPLDFYYS